MTETGRPRWRRRKLWTGRLTRGGEQGSRWSKDDEARHRADIAELERQLAVISVPFEWGARRLGFVDLQQCMQLHGYFWWPSNGPTT